MRYVVYILYSPSFNQTYIGQTNNLQNRLIRHNGGMVISTKRYVPWTLIHSETFTTRAEAMKREAYLKSGIGREQVQAILAEWLIASAEGGRP